MGAEPVRSWRSEESSALRAWKGESVAEVPGAVSQSLSLPLDPTLRRRLQISRPTTPTKMQPTRKSVAAAKAYVMYECSVCLASSSSSCFASTASCSEICLRWPRKRSAAVGRSLMESLAISSGPGRASVGNGIA